MPTPPLKRIVGQHLPALAALFVVVLLLLAARSPLRPASHAPGPALFPESASPLADQPLDQWTAGFLELEASGRWEILDRELEVARARHRDVYDRYLLGYLQARAKMEAGHRAAAREAFAPFLAPGHVLRDLALFYTAQLADAEGDHEGAAQAREELIFFFPVAQTSASYRARAIADHAEHLARRADAVRLAAFADQLSAGVDAPTRRAVEARLVERLQEEKSPEAVERRALRENAGDEAADRIFRALDRPELVDRLGPEEWALLGEAAQSHRRFDRAVPLLRRAIPGLPRRRAELLFALGRSHFGAEDYAAAERVYLEGAASAPQGESRASFLYQAARAAQLQGADGRAEAALTRALALMPAPRAGKRRASRRRSAAAVAPRGAVALTQRLRLRLAARRLADADADLRLLQRRFPASEALVDGAMAYAAAQVAAGRNGAALRALSTVPVRTATRYDEAELEYWRARALEASEPAHALEGYLRVLRAPVPTHFAHFARLRLAGPLLAAPARDRATRGVAEAERLRAAGDLEGARRIQTEVVLLTPPDEIERELARLREIYAELPSYRAVLELQPYDLPRLPLPESADGPDRPLVLGAGRLDLLLAMGLFDDAAESLALRYPLTPAASALTRAEALRRAGAARASIRAAEAVVDALPPEYVPQLLPPQVRQLLYPRYYDETIAADARRYGADPRLLLAIMREESRFDRRARSGAAARGLLQFVIATARDVGRQVGLLEISPEDLYDPRIVIQLGAKYLADLLQQFQGNPYRAAAAYNAGPHQARLWSRLAPGPGDDEFLATVNFDETKGYVRKVLNSYQRYAEIYPESPQASAAGAP